MKILRYVVAWTIVAIVGAALIALFGYALWTQAHERDTQVAAAVAAFIGVVYVVSWVSFWALAVVLGRNPPRFLRFDELVETMFVVPDEDPADEPS